MPEKPITELFHGAIAFARAITQNDWVGAETLYNISVSPLDLLIPMSWLLESLITKVAMDTDHTPEEVWINIISSIDTVNDDSPEE